MSTIARGGPGQNQGPGIPCGSPTWVAETYVLEPLTTCCLSAGNWIGSGEEIQTQACGHPNCHLYCSATCLHLKDWLIPIMYYLAPLKMYTEKYDMENMEKYQHIALSYLEKEKWIAMRLSKYQCLSLEFYEVLGWFQLFIYQYLFSYCHSWAFIHMNVGEEKKNSKLY